jgi:hypothetical protein
MAAELGSLKADNDHQRQLALDAVHQKQSSTEQHQTAYAELLSKERAASNELAHTQALLQAAGIELEELRQRDTNVELAIQQRTQEAVASMELAVQSRIQEAVAATTQKQAKAATSPSETVEARSVSDEELRTALAEAQHAVKRYGQVQTELQSALEVASKHKHNAERFKAAADRAKKMLKKTMAQKASEVDAITQQLEHTRAQQEQTRAEVDEERKRRMAVEEQASLERQKADILSQRIEVTLASEDKLRNQLDTLFARFNDQLDLQQRTQSAHAQAIFEATERVTTNSFHVQDERSRRAGAESSVVHMERNFETSSGFAAMELQTAQQRVQAAEAQADASQQQAARLMEKEATARRDAEERARLAMSQLEAATTGSGYASGAFFSAEMSAIDPRVAASPQASFASQQAQPAPPLVIGPAMVGQWVDTHAGPGGSARRGYVVGYESGQQRLHVSWQDGSQGIVGHAEIADTLTSAASSRRHVGQSAEAAAAAAAAEARPMMASPSLSPARRGLRLPASAHR